MIRAPTIQQSMILLLEWTSHGMLEHDMPTSQHDTSALNWITDCCHTLMFSYTLKFVWASLNMLRSSKLRLAISSLNMPSSSLFPNLRPYPHDVRTHAEMCSDLRRHAWIRLFNCVQACVELRKCINNCQDKLFI